MDEEKYDFEGKLKTDLTETLKLLWHKN
jgi:hypothetical protein